MGRVSFWVVETDPVVTGVARERQNRKIAQSRRGRGGTQSFLLACTLVFAACSSKTTASEQPQSTATVAAAPANLEFPAPEKFGGFDARRAYAHVQTTVGYGPRPVGSEAWRKSQEYIKAQLAGANCAVEEDDFEAATPLGRMKMKNIVGKAAGEKPEVILFLTHYETKNMPELPTFVGANDPGSSVAVVLELARLLCAPDRKRSVTYWFGFVDGEEAFGEWSDTNSTFGSRQMAAKLSLSGELKKIKAVVLFDMVGGDNFGIRRESNSTTWLTDILWSTAKRLGYGQHFLDSSSPTEDDHIPFLRRNVPAVDIIEAPGDYEHWHTAQDTLDKISPRSLAMVGHVVLESLPDIEKRKQAPATKP